MVFLVIGTLTLIAALFFLAARWFSSDDLDDSSSNTAAAVAAPSDRVPVAGPDAVLRSIEAGQDDGAADETGSSLPRPLTHPPHRQATVYGAASVSQREIDSMQLAMAI